VAWIWRTHCQGHPAPLPAGPLRGPGRRTPSVLLPTQIQTRRGGTDLKVNQHS
uniref:Uncharacterized protein n=2 Tax=Sus scrofa TaxID=9823 RepID=A0A8D0QCD7_PIG